MQVKVDSTTRETTPNPGFRSGEQWYSVDPPEFSRLPQRNSVVDIQPYQHADGKQHFSADTMVLVQAAPPGGWQGNKGGPAGGFKPGAKKGGFKSGYDNLGQQIGNAVTNATALICAGKVPVQEGQLIKVLTKLAHQLVLAGDGVRALHDSGAAVAQPAQTQPAPQQMPVQQVVQAAQPAAQVGQQVAGAQPQAAPDFDDDIPF